MVPDLAAYGDRLKGDGPVGAANENIGAEARPEGCFAGCADIVASEETRAGDRFSEHRPDHHAAAGHAEVKPILGDRAVIVLLPTRPAWLVRREYAGHLLLRPDDQPDSGRHIARQQSGPDLLAGRRLRRCDSQHNSHSPHGMTQHITPPCASMTPIPAPPFPSS